MKKNNLTLDSIAGYCSERLAWMLVAKIAELHQQLQGMVNPFCLCVEGTGFELNADALTSSNETPYAAPEGTKGEASDVWSMAATVFYVVMGCNVMNGEGGVAQRPDSVLPWMRSEMPELSQLIVDCLAYEPSSRPTMASLAALAQNGIRVAKEREGEHPRQKVTIQRPQANIDLNWPEEMA